MDRADSGSNRASHQGHNAFEGGKIASFCILSGVLVSLKKGPELLQGAMVACEEGPNRLLEQCTNLSKAHSTDMPEIDDLSIGL